MDQETNIEFCVKLGKTLAETYCMLLKVYVNHTLPLTTVERLYNKYLQDHMKLQNFEHVDRIRKLLRRDRILTIELLEDLTNLKKPLLEDILFESLKLRVLCTHLVPRLLSDDQKLSRVKFAKDMVMTAGNDPTFLDHLVVGGRAWCFEIKPEKADVQPDGPSAAKRICLRESRLKVNLIVFFDAEGIMYREFLDDISQLSSEFYNTLINRRLYYASQTPRGNYSKPHTWPLLYCDPDDDHKSINVKYGSHKKHVIKVDFPAYSPDLSPCDFFLFQTVKEIINFNQEFSNVNDLRDAVDKALNSILKTECKDAIGSMIDRCNQVISVNGEYIELRV